MDKNVTLFQVRNAYFNQKYIWDKLYQVKRWIFANLNSKFELLIEIADNVLMVWQKIGNISFNIKN